jgi:hypothetical protein
MSEDELGQFIGTTDWYRHPLFRGFTYTEGVRYVAQRAGAYWLVEAIFSHQLDKKAKAEAFQVWTLTRTPEGGASLVMTDGDTETEIIRQDIEYTDFPLVTFSVYLTDQVLMLKSEY